MKIYIYILYAIYCLSSPAPPPPRTKKLIQIGDGMWWCSKNRKQGSLSLLMRGLKSLRWFQSTMSTFSWGQACQKPNGVRIASHTETMKRRLAFRITGCRINPTVSTSEHTTDNTTIWPILYFVPETTAVSVRRSPEQSRTPKDACWSPEAGPFLPGNWNKGAVKSPL